MRLTKCTFLLKSRFFYSGKIEILLKKVDLFERAYGWMAFGLEPSCIITKKCVLQIIKVKRCSTNGVTNFFFSNWCKSDFPTSYAPLKKISIAVFASEYAAKSTWSIRNVKFENLAMQSSVLRLAKSPTVCMKSNYFMDEYRRPMENCFPSFYYYLSSSSEQIVSAMFFPFNRQLNWFIRTARISWES